MTSAALAVGLSVMGSSFAADVMAEPAYDWSGYYTGVHGGWASFGAGIGPGSLNPPGASGSTLDGGGGLYGLLAGINFQQDQLVYGIEGDISFGTLAGANAVSTLPSFDIDYVGTLRGRVGIAVERLQFFGTAGIGLIGATAFERAGGSRSSGTHTGLVVGAGVEYAVSNNFLIRGEYMHGFYGQNTYTVGSTTHSHDIGFDTNVVRGALIWKF